VPKVEITTALPGDIHGTDRRHRCQGLRIYTEMLTDDPGGDGGVYPDNEVDTDIFGPSLETDGCEAPSGTSSNDTALVEGTSDEVCGIRFTL
jgi:hypothetical protein